MPYSPNLAARIVAGATRNQLRAEGFSFGNKLFTTLKSGIRGRLAQADIPIQALKYGLKSTRKPSGSMLIPSGSDLARGRYTYRAKIILKHPYFGKEIVGKGGRRWYEQEIIGRFNNDSLLTGKQIREKMQSIGEQALNTSGRKTQVPQYNVQGRLKRIEILATLINE